MLSEPVQRSVSSVWVQECATKGRWQDDTAICRQVKWLQASISEVSSFMAICSFCRKAQSSMSTDSCPNSLTDGDGDGTRTTSDGYQRNRYVVSMDHLTNRPTSVTPLNNDLSLFSLNHETVNQKEKTSCCAYAHGIPSKSPCLHQTRIQRHYINWFQPYIFNKCQFQ